VRVEIVAVGTELLLGQLADTNSRWLGEQLAANGVISTFHQHVDDDHLRMVLALRTALARSDGVIVCGGLGPTQDDLTREAIAAVMGVELVRDPAIETRIESMFASRGREMPDNNRRQADVPVGAQVIEQRRGTAPGLLCPIGRKVLYAVPGVPHELEEMFERAIAPDLRSRLAAGGETGTIASRVLRTWGTSESGLAEALDGYAKDLDGSSCTLAFLASGIEGLKVRVTTRAPSEEAARRSLAAEEATVRAILAQRFGDVVFGVDDETMEDVVAGQLRRRSLTLAVAESLTGGLVASRLVNVDGASEWFRGAIVSYAGDVKQALLGVPDGPVVTPEAAEAMARGVRSVLRSDVGLALTGVAGPEPDEGIEVGTVFVGLAIGDEAPTSIRLRLPGDRQRVRDYATISALDWVRRALASLG